MVDGIQAERHQATTIIPLVMVQVALFGVVVLALALAAVVDQRRPELATARLRGAGARRVGWSLSVELGGPVLAGILTGLLVGFGLLRVVGATWLDNGAPLEMPWTVPASVAVAALVGLAVVAWTVRTVVRQPISTLLRRIVPRRRGRTLGAVDLVVIVLASAGLAAALTGGGRGPLPVLTPTLLALAVGLTFAHLLLPVAGAISRRALRSGRLGLALGALQVSRRPAVTRIVAVVAVASALVSFAGQAASVAGHNRDVRAGYETGAQGLLKVQLTGLGTFLTAVQKVDPDRRWMTPVVVTSPPSPDALTALMIEPASFQRIAYGGARLADEDGYGELRAPDQQGVELVGRQARLTVSAGPLKPVKVPTNNGVVAPDEPPAKPLGVQADVVQADGQRVLVRFGTVPFAPAGPVTLTAPISCDRPCRILRLGIYRAVGDASGVQGELKLSRLSTDTQPRVELGAGETWAPLSSTQSALESLAAQTAPGGGLGLKVTSHGSELKLQNTSAPSPLPALVTEDIHLDDQPTVPGLDGLATPIRPSPLPGPVPRYSQRTAVIDLANVARLGGSPDPATAVYQLWLNADGLAASDRIINDLRAAGVSATMLDRLSTRSESYSRSSSALALRLTPVIGIAGWTLAIIVLLLMVVTSWRSRAQDYASLRMSGVPAAATGRAARWEQTGPVALATLLGSACGVVGAQIALPLIPLFAETSQPSPIPLELGTNWTAAAALWLIGTLVLALTTLMLGTGVNRRASYARIREELS